jgi:uncharacterized protein YggE
MRKTIIITGLAFALAAQLAAQAPRPAGEAADIVPMLSVSGTGEARVAPDEATVRLGVVAQAPTARAAQEQVNRTANAVLEAIRKQGIEAEDIQTSGLSLSPMYSQGRPDAEERAPRITGYQANNTVTIRVEDLTKVGPIIDAGLGAGANNLEGVVFGLRNDEAARRAALADAVREARAKAEALAQALKVQLAGIVDVTEGGISVYPPPYPKVGRVAMAEFSQADTPVSAGQVGVEASVTIRYRIAQ